MEPSDRELMARLAAGDREALGPLMERHHRRLYRIALSYLRDPDEALDAVQETFVKAFQDAARWDGAAEVAPWLSRIAVNHADRPLPRAAGAAARRRRRWTTKSTTARARGAGALAGAAGLGPRGRASGSPRRSSACPSGSGPSSSCGTTKR